MPRYRGRFAPSPTGPLHFGSLVAAVGSFLEARTRGGDWLVRMEDLDPPRVAPGAAVDILRALQACGLEWDGSVARQSERSDAYHGALHRLRQGGRVYPCVCSRREIADSAVAGSEGPVYPGTCRAGLAAGKTARALRLSTQGVTIEFDDAVQGRVAHDLERDSGDFVLYRADEVYAYQLAVVVDDAEQGITDVVRGATCRSPSTRPARSSPSRLSPRRSTPRGPCRPSPPRLISWVSNHRPGSSAGRSVNSGTGRWITGTWTGCHAWQPRRSRFALTADGWRLAAGGFYQKNGSDCAVGFFPTRHDAIPPRYHITLV
jgi:glutamyl-queuosine tRNA(Asp) synthetase